LGTPDRTERKIAMVRNALIAVALLVVAMVATPVQKLSSLAPDSQSSTATPVPQVLTSIDTSTLASNVQVVVPDSASAHGGASDSGAAPVATPTQTYPAATPDASGHGAAGTVVVVDPAQASLTPAGSSPAAEPKVATTMAPVGTVVPMASIAAPAATAVPTKKATPVATAAPTKTAAPTPRAAPTKTSAPTATVAPSTWTFDLYNAAAERYQDPDMTACTAASTESMLNTIAATGSGSGLVWRPTTSYSTEESILAYERAHMTMLTTSAGSDPNGWRNALNYFGWGSIDAGIYRDVAYGSFDAAARATVLALAATHKPVGILGHAGGHAQFVTGYRVTGADPATGSSAFAVVGVYLTDPLRSNGHRDTFISYSSWRSGGTWVRFSAYTQTDSPYVDPIDGRVGRSEWYGKWVLIDPVR
jgi:hypothetical protein